MTTAYTASLLDLMVIGTLTLVTEAHIRSQINLVGHFEPAVHTLAAARISRKTSLVEKAMMGGYGSVVLQCEYDLMARALNQLVIISEMYMRRACPLSVMSFTLTTTTHLPVELPG